MSVPMITLEELKKWAPNANFAYIQTLLKGETFLREASILDDRLTLCHFMGQVGGETNGLTILRENLNYTTVTRVRAVWPKRTRGKSDAWIKMNLIGKPEKIADFAYGGRMGNRKGTSDAYDFRGGGFLQATGLWACQEYCKRTGIPFNNQVLDDIPTTLRFACEEWKSSGCNTYALQNDLLSVSKIINTGSAKSGVKPNGLKDREIWFARAWKIWGDPRRETVGHTSAITAKDLKKAGSETIKTGELIQAGGVATAVVGAAQGTVQNTTDLVVQPVTPTATVVEQLQTVGDGADTVTTSVNALKGFYQFLAADFWLVLIIVGCVGVYLGRHIIARRLADARLGYHIGRILEKFDPGPAETPA
jgi:putative chitinase